MNWVDHLTTGSGARLARPVPSQNTDTARLFKIKGTYRFHKCISSCLDKPAYFESAV